MTVHTGVRLGGCSRGRGGVEALAPGAVAVVAAGGESAAAAMQLMGQAGLTTDMMVLLGQHMQGRV